MNFSIKHKKKGSRKTNDFGFGVCRGLVSAMLTESMRPDSAPQRRVRLASDNEIE
jgi:hypothetical protein